MTTFVHSGNLGDIIYSLPAVRALGGGTMYIKLDGVADAIRKYNNGPVPDDYRGRLSAKDFEMLAPLLDAQPYIEATQVFHPNQTVEVDLDQFRAVAGQSFATNFLSTYNKALGLPDGDISGEWPWLFVEPTKIAEFVVCRSARYRSNKSSTIPTWKAIIDGNDFENRAVFVGLPEEAEEFNQLFDVSIPYYKCKDFLDMAQVIAGADTFFGNQTFAYGIAQGLGKDTVLETLTWRPLVNNECFFERDGCVYF